MVKIAPSILAADFMHLEEEIKSVEEAGADYIHVDVMDGKFVPNQTPGLEMLKRSKAVSHLTIDTHLMVENPLEYIEQLSNMNIEFVTFHVEVNKNIGKIIKSIHDKNVHQNEEKNG